jgi:conjugal transfer pilus assembly protein TraW
MNKRGSVLAIFFVFITFFTLPSAMTSAMADDLGVYGHVYSIAEPDLLTFIHARLEGFKKTGRLKAMQKAFIHRARAFAMHPPAVTGVHDAATTQTFYFTPHFVLKRSIYDARGNLLYPAGIVINPLDAKTIKKINPYATASAFNEVLFFIDGDDAKQVQWVKQQQKQVTGMYKIILVKGNVAKASQTLGRVYFDLHGVLCHHFGIKAVPAVLKRQGKKLQIKQVALHHIGAAS